MHYNEVAFVAERIAAEMLKRDFVAKGVVGKGVAVRVSGVLCRFIACEIHAARTAWNVSSESVRSLKISEGVGLLKARIRELVPATFGWWMEIDHDLNFAVRWMWLGHPAVTRSGSVSDCDVSIMLAGLESVNWDEQATLAMADVEQTEADLLRVAQDRRRLKLSNPAQALALPAVEMPTMAVVPFADKKAALGPKERPKRRETSDELAARMKRAEELNPLAERKEKRAREIERLEQSMEGYLDEKKQRSPISANVPALKAAPPVAASPAPQIEECSNASSNESNRVPAAGWAEIGRVWTGSPKEFPHSEGNRAEWFLSREAATRPLAKTTWLPLRSLSEVMDAILANPMGTFKQAWGFGGIARIRTAEKVWEMTGQTVPENWSYRALRARQLTGESAPGLEGPQPGEPPSFWFRRN